MTVGELEKMLAEWHDKSKPVTAFIMGDPKGNFEIIDFWMGTGGVSLELKNKG